MKSEELEKVFHFCEKNKIFLILDETYRDFIYPYQKQPHKIFNNKNWRSNFIHLYSFSKSCCIPGQRLGALIADKSIINQISKIMDNIQICAPRPAQQALAIYLDNLERFQMEKTKEIGEKSKLFYKIISKYTNWKIASTGGFFSYLEHPFKFISSFEISKHLAEKCGIISLPGTCFGYNQEKYLRFSFASIDHNMFKEIPNRFKKLESFYSVSNKLTVIE